MKLIFKIEFMLKKYVLYTPVIYKLLKLTHFDNRREPTVHGIYSARQAVLTTTNDLCNTVIIISFLFQTFILEIFLCSGMCSVYREVCVMWHRQYSRQEYRSILKLGS